ncbi:hypothetical protein QYE76_029471 [Lolium multiflorum]|uniref:Reverse transcriptase domain-containing protein n=1 Tax=Lolium multiflorum TaxID=4521 RepID=A0AAD8QMX6_LOLMU|nr:hypothetical protein QYE76_029471 [Lolium multiflorum]
MASGGKGSQGALDGVDLSAPSEERTRSPRQEINFMVAHSLHRHSENLVNTLERVALRVIQEIMRHQYSPSGPALGTYQGEMPLQSRPPLPFTLTTPEVPNSPAYAVDMVECTYPGRDFSVPTTSTSMRAEILEEVKKEIEKMLAGFIRPCRYAEWISDRPVEKKDGRWRVAIDFRDLNRATPKDEYPMPVAETLINAAAGHKVLSFMDGNAGYNQIFMAPEDIHKIAFRVPGAVGLFEYVVMTFGLKNAGAYQRAMNYIFHDLIGKLVEIYIDDVVVKSVSMEGHLDDLRRVLDRTRKFGLRMNPKKRAFGVTAGQFLGFLVHERGIEIGLKSQEAVRTMQPPTTKKELQRLIGKINFVRRFISNLSGRIEPFIALVKIKSDDEFHSKATASV